MNIKKFNLSMYMTNCYVVYDGNKNCFIVDPGAADNGLVDFIKKNELKLQYIILTHGHGDHTGGIPQLKKEFPEAVLVANKAEEKLLYDRRFSFGSGGIVADQWSKGGDELVVGDMTLKFIDTPGHTPGGQCILVDKTLFSGDTLFRWSIGRTDFPGGSFETIIQSIKEKLFLLPDDTRVLPGHEAETTIGDEKRMNPFV